MQHLPSTISSPVIVAVGATDSYDNFWPQSNYGTKTVQVGMLASQGFRAVSLMAAACPCFHVNTVQWAYFASTARQRLPHGSRSRKFWCSDTCTNRGDDGGGSFVSFVS